jgi:hypothetical protein
MNRFAIAGCLAAALMSSSPAGAETLFVCGMGMLRHVETLLEPVATHPSGTIAERRVREGGRQLLVNASSPRRTKSYLVTIELDGVRYTARSADDALRTSDPTRFRVNTAIPTCLDEDLLMFRPTGSETLKTTIIEAVHRSEWAWNHR